MQRQLTKIFSVSKSHDSLSTNTDREHETVSMMKEKIQWMKQWVCLVCEQCGKDVA